MKTIVSVVVGGLLAGASVAVQAQTPVASVAGAADRASAEQRYQIGQMERVLEGAVEHGLTVTRDRVQALAQAPGELMVSDNAHARGFRLEGYGVFFDVVVPSFETTWTMSLRTLDQNDLGLDSALKALKAHVDAEGDVNLTQALRRLELQVSPGVTTRTASAAAAPGTRNASGAAASTSQDAVDPILADPNEAYRTEVTNALKDVMLAHSSSLGIGPTEWLTVAAKGNDDRPRLAPADTDAHTRTIRLRGADLADFLAGRITREEALQRIEVRVF
jgi:hypothetical protein